MRQVHVGTRVQLDDLGETFPLELGIDDRRFVGSSLANRFLAGIRPPVGRQ